MSVRTRPPPTESRNPFSASYRASQIDPLDGKPKGVNRAHTFESFVTPDKLPEVDERQKRIGSNWELLRALKRAGRLLRGRKGRKMKAKKGEKIGGMRGEGIGVIREEESGAHVQRVLVHEKNPFADGVD